MGTRGARVWIFVGFVMGFAAVIASCSILFTVYINRGKLILFNIIKQRKASLYAHVVFLLSLCKKRIKKGFIIIFYPTCYVLEQLDNFIKTPVLIFIDVKSPGVSLFLQNVFICIASIIFKFGRSEDVWG